MAAFIWYRRPGGGTLAQQSIKHLGASVSELGMEAIWKIEVEDFPAFITGG